MTPPPVSRRLAAVVGLAIMAARCGESGLVGPVRLSNPGEIPGRLQAVSTPFNSQVYHSFANLIGRFHPAASPIGLAVTLAGATQPVLPAVIPSARGPYFRGARQAQALRQLLRSLGSVLPTAIFPPEAVGKTYVWNPTTLAYEVSGRTGAPSNGVRLILYAIDAQTLLPDASSEIGYIDLVDASSSTGSSVALQVDVVRTQEPASVTYVHYTVSVAATQTPDTVTDAGYVTDGTTRLDFRGTITATQTSATFDIHFDVNAQDVHLQLVLEFTPSTQRIEFTFGHGTEVITTAGTLTKASGALSGTLTVTVNGGTFATCDADDDGFVGECQGASGTLTSEEQAALAALGGAIFDNAVFAGFFDSVNAALAVMGFPPV